MKAYRIVVVKLILVALCLQLLPANAQEATKKSDAPLVQKLSPAPAKASTDEKPARSSSSERLPRRGLTLRQSRDLGITLRNVREAHKAVEADGRIDEESSEAEVVAAVAAEIQATNAESFRAASAEEAELDWVAILELILKFLEMLGIL